MSPIRRMTPSGQNDHLSSWQHITEQGFLTLSAYSVREPSFIQICPPVLTVILYSFSFVIGGSSTNGVYVIGLISATPATISFPSRRLGLYQIGSSLPTWICVTPPIMPSALTELSQCFDEQFGINPGSTLQETPLNLLNEWVCIGSTARLLPERFCMIGKLCHLSVSFRPYSFAAEQ